MKHLSLSGPIGEAIDRFAEDLARYPDRVDDLKLDLFRKLGGRPATAVTLPPRRAISDAADLDEFWDNVPL